MLVLLAEGYAEWQTANIEESSTQEQVEAEDTWNPKNQPGKGRNRVSKGRDDH